MLVSLLIVGDPIKIFKDCDWSIKAPRSKNLMNFFLRLLLLFHNRLPYQSRFFEKSPKQFYTSFSNALEYRDSVRSLQVIIHAYKSYY
jgi:hypothetical protein